jgi:hypothetical protein
LYFCTVVRCSSSLGIREVNHRPGTLTSDNVSLHVTCPRDMPPQSFPSPSVPTFTSLLAPNNCMMHGKVHDTCSVQSPATCVVTKTNQQQVPRMA